MIYDSRPWMMSRNPASSVQCRTYGARIIVPLFPSPTPDFLWNLVALANFMRLSLLKGARAASSRAAWQEIRSGLS
jgi:hypothetical protein